MNTFRSLASSHGVSISTQVCDGFPARGWDWTRASGAQTRGWDWTRASAVQARGWDWSR